MAKTVFFKALGGPENLVTEDATLRAPGPDEARLRVQAVGLNRAELMYMGGYYLEQPELPSRICYEAAGVVEAVGEGVDASWVGKQVATVPGYSMNKFGVLAEEAIVPASSLAEYPEKLSPAEGAAIWMQYLTAYGALVMHGQVGAGDNVLITAASSSVGLAAIQIVKDAGGVAIATTRHGDKRKALLDQGADHVIATEEEDLAARVREITGGKMAQIIFDPVAGPFVEKLAEAAGYGATIFIYGLLSMQPTPFPLRPALGKGLILRGYTLHELIVNTKEFARAKHYCFERLADGRFVPIIAKTFPFEQTVAAYQYLASNAQVGKVVITL